MNEMNRPKTKSSGGSDFQVHTFCRYDLERDTNVCNEQSLFGLVSVAEWSDIACLHVAVDVARVPVPAEVWPNEEVRLSCWIPARSDRCLVEVTSISTWQDLWMAHRSEDR